VVEKYKTLRKDEETQNQSQKAKISKKIIKKLSYTLGTEAMESFKGQSIGWFQT
tara:strand:+ start:151 stop:312 length:162 start_codon:yes stop_codon:yes gene_type:complete